MKCNDEVYSDTLIKFIPSDFRGRILCLFIGDLITEAAIAEKLPDADIYVADLPQFGFEAFDPNLHKLNFEFTPGKAYTESELVTEIQGMFEGLKMKFDYVLINPPFSLGNAVATECLKHSDRVVCLMPLSKYKKGKLWSKITQFSLADPKLFTDALITPNLSISTLENNAKPKFESESNLTLEGYSKDFLEVYKWNINHKGLNGPYYSTPGGAETDKVIAKRVKYETTFAISGRAVFNGIHLEGAKDYEWNNKKTKSLGGRLDFYEMPSEKAKDNLTKWWYYKGKKGLANSLLKGLNKASGSCEDAIPQINWEEIENTDAWKAGDYDTAVLDMMNLKLVDGKIVKKSAALFESEEALEFESFDPNLRPFYDYNKEHWGQCLTDTVFRGSEKKLAEKKVNNKEWFAISDRAGANGVHSSGFDFDWNPKTQDTIIRTKTGDFMEQMLKCKSEKSKDNLVKWFYYAGKSGLANKVLKGLNTDCGTLAIWSIPQIDFEKIEESPLWQQGLFDEAVLDAMDLKMDENGVVVKK